MTKTKNSSTDKIVGLKRTKTAPVRLTSSIKKESKDHPKAGKRDHKVNGSKRYENQVSNENCAKILSTRKGQSKNNGSNMLSPFKSTQNTSHVSKSSSGGGSQPMTDGK